MDTLPGVLGRFLPPFCFRGPRAAARSCPSVFSALLASCDGNFGMGSAGSPQDLLTAECATHQHPCPLMRHRRLSPRVPRPARFGFGPEVMVLEEFACGMDGASMSLHAQPGRSGRAKKGKCRAGKSSRAVDEDFSIPECSLDEAAEQDLSIIKGPWSAPEDALLRTLVEEHGPKRWSMIAAKLPGRIGKQACRVAAFPCPGQPNVSNLAAGWRAVSRAMAQPSEPDYLQRCVDNRGGRHHCPGTPLAGQQVGGDREALTRTHR